MQHGLSFGLGVVTVDHSLKASGPVFVAIGPGNQPKPAPRAHLTPYKERLAWIALFRSDLVSSCPVQTPARPPRSQGSRSPLSKCW